VAAFLYLTVPAFLGIFIPNSKRNPTAPYGSKSKDPNASAKQYEEF
jgi:hypothetical protein